MSTFLSWIKQQNLVVVILYKNNKIEGVVLNKVCILQIFYPIETGKGQGFKPTMAHLYLKIGRNLVKNVSITMQQTSKYIARLPYFHLETRVHDSFAEKCKISNKKPCWVTELVSYAHDG